MKQEEITYKEIAAVMPRITRIHRNWGYDEQETLCCIIDAMSTFVYDMANGSSLYASADGAMDFLGIEPDYIMEFYEGMCALNYEEDNPYVDEDDVLSPELEAELDYYEEFCRK